MLYRVKATVCSDIQDAWIQLWVERRICNVEPLGFKRLNLQLHAYTVVLKLKSNI